MNLKELSEKLELEESELLHLLGLFVKTCSSDLNLLQSAIDKGDAPGAASVAHSIKGAAIILGLTAISEFAQRIEVDALEKDLLGFTELVEGIKKELNWIVEKLETKGLDSETQE
jgi:HPt (histidine-containing phosphotransfer) domain-containing protein